MRTMKFLATALAALALATTVAHAQVSVMVQSPRRAWLGFSYDAVTDAPGRAGSGVVVRSIVEDSPAERAGLQVGDTIVSINQINANRQFIASLGSALEPGDDVRVDVRRGGTTRTLTITAATPPDDHIGFGAASGLVRIDGDSIRSLVRVFVDSAFAGIDTLRVPDVVFRRGDGSVRLFSDSVFTFGDSVVFRRGGDVSVFRFFDSDSLRSELDSLRTRLFSEPFRYRSFPDSAFASAFVYTPADSVIAGWRYGGTPFGFTMAGRSAIAGAELTRLDPAMEEYFGVAEGVLVTRVPRDTPAARAGLQAGDVIVAINGSDVDTVDELRRQIQRTPREESVRLEVVRRNRHITVELGTD